MKDIELTVGEDDRVIVVTDYTYRKGRPMRPSRVRFDPPEPPEPEELEDIECKWQDTDAKLTDEEFELYQERIEEEIYERIREYNEPDDEPRDD